MTVVRPESAVRALSWPAARDLAGRSARPLPPAGLPLSEALGCRLAAPLRALVAVPGADVAAMDGYAVAGAPPWQVVGRVLAGGVPYEAALRAGEAVEIATGAPVPPGAESVLPYEQASRTSGGLGRAGVPAPSDSERTGPPASEGLGRAGASASGGLDQVEGEIEAGRHIRRRGEDIAEGAVVLGAGAVVTPVVVGLAAALGHDVLTVRPMPSVAVLVTGDEVVDHGLPGPGRVRDAIGPFLPGLVAWAGGRLASHARLPDGAAALHAALSALAPPSHPEKNPPPAMSSPREGAPPREEPRLPHEESRQDLRTPEGGGVEVVVVCGASSRGPADHLRGVLGELGAEVLVDGVAVRPGHPQLLARLPGGTLVVGLPGNPFAALAAAMTLLVPVLRGFGGAGSRRESSALAGPVRAHERDTRLVPVLRSGRGAIPAGHDRPGSLWGAALAEALAVVPPGWSGEQVELIELPTGG
ncbi:molybdopterin-binding protein [Nonomuraea sp. MCN248]|uniref:Molybdopterin molybdenumtransferase n=1 Tax=Nonomuraea corallina TaxID=2989783 RepID=A0ABT4SD11_9ACTN|nr:molybdopterin-binding protein [Nonomuraea corallina]MDA0635098.1 molybdopterin-binding protein [Nonomuraea corallina]